MASPISRTLYRSARCRLYSSQAAALKSDASQLQNGGTKVSNVNGIKVATLENNSPLSRVLIVVQAGSRYEDPSNLGITHTIRHAAELTNDMKSSFRLCKDLQFNAGCVDVSTTRDLAFYGISCVRENVEANVPNLVGMVTRSIIKPFDWEAFDGLKPRLDFDIASLNLQPNAKVFELLHSAAFRDSLGNSLYCPSTFVGKHTPEQVLSFMANHYGSDRVAVVGSGVNHDFLASIAKQMSFKSNQTPTPNKATATYFAGEARENRPDLEFTYAAVATQGPSASSQDTVAAGVLQQIMGCGSYIKYGTGNATSKLAQAVSKQTDLFSVRSFNANYSDTGLFGFVVAAQAESMGKVLKAAFSEFAAATKGGITDADVQRGKAQLKTYVLMNMEDSNSQVQALGESMFGAGEAKSANEIIAAIDAVTTADVNSVAKKLVNGKPSMASVGDLSSIPYLEDLLKV